MLNETDFRHVCARINASTDAKIAAARKLKESPTCVYRKVVSEEAQQALMDANPCFAMTSDEGSFDHLACTLREWSEELGCWQCLHPKRPGAIVGVCTVHRVCLLLHPCKDSECCVVRS